MFNSTRKLLIDTEALPKTLIKNAYYMFFFPVEVNQALGAAYLLGFSGSLCPPQLLYQAYRVCSADRPQPGHLEALVPAPIKQEQKRRLEADVIMDAYLKSGKPSLDKHPGLSDSQDSIRSRGAGNHAWIASPLHSESASMPESHSPAVCIGAGSHCLPTGEP